STPAAPEGCTAPRGASARAPARSSPETARSAGSPSLSSAPTALSLYPMTNPPATSPRREQRHDRRDEVAFRRCTASEKKLGAGRRRGPFRAPPPGRSPLETRKERMRMQTLTFRRFVGLGAALLRILLLAAAPSAAADPASGRGVQRDAMTHEFETLLGQFPGTSSGTPSEGAVFTDLGGGFYTVFVPLSPALRARFLEAARESAPTDKAAQSLFVISVGQAPTVPTTPVAATHGALSDTTYPYTYWVITLNLGANTVTKTTSVKLTGPGLH